MGEALEWWKLSSNKKLGRIKNKYSKTWRWRIRGQLEQRPARTQKILGHCHRGSETTLCTHTQTHANSLTSSLSSSSETNLYLLSSGHSGSVLHGLSWLWHATCCCIGDTLNALSGLRQQNTETGKYDKAIKCSCLGTMIYVVFLVFFKEMCYCTEKILWMLCCSDLIGYHGHILTLVCS